MPYSFSKNPTTEPVSVKLILIFIALGFLGLLILLPTIVIFTEAFSKGIDIYLQILKNPYAVSSIKITLIVAVIAVPLNILFGVAASWVIAKFEFIGKRVLITLIDIPFSVSPIISGLICMLLFGMQTTLGKCLFIHHFSVIFALPGLIIVTLFVTLPFVARELIPLMEEQGNEEEEAAIMLGASGWQTFRRITLPNIKWGLLYGTLLCNARAMGEFGAVSVISGHIQGKTLTIPLYVELLYNEYSFTMAFAMASILTLLALLTLFLKTVLEASYPSKEVR